MDIYALSLVKLGCGNNLIGYYMYKGGTNKIGKLSTFNETKESGYPNDYTTLSYDFQAPLSQYGEIRDHYRSINMLHMFVADFGDVLATMEAVMAEKELPSSNLDELRYAMRTDGNGGFVFINNYQRLARMKQIDDVVIDTGTAVFPSIDIKSGVSFIMPFNITLSGVLLEYATAQLLCRDKNTYFFVAIDGIEPKFKFKGNKEFICKVGKDTVTKIGGIKIITLTADEAKYTRKLNNSVYIGDEADIYYDSDIRSADERSICYYKWNGGSFDKYETEHDFTQAELILADTPQPFEPTEKYDLEIGGKRMLTWKRLETTSGDGFIEIPFEYDAAQIYVNGTLSADDFYIGVPWRIPASLVYGKECYLVMSELRNDFYREI